LGITARPERQKPDEARSQSEVGPAKLIVSRKYAKNCTKKVQRYPIDSRGHFLL
jgi:hypothetical protein